MDTTNGGRAPGTGSSALTQLCDAHTALFSTADILSAASVFGRSHQKSRLFSPETVSLQSMMSDLHASLSWSCQLLSLQLLLNQLHKGTRDRLAQGIPTQPSPTLKLLLFSKV